MSKLSLYRNFLQDNGFRPQVADDAIAFVCEGTTYVLLCDDADPTYFHMLLPCFWRVESPADHARAVEVAVMATRRIKACKVVLEQRPQPGGSDGGNGGNGGNGAGTEFATVSIELFLPRAEDFAAVFMRSLQAMRMAAHCFAATMAAQAAKEVPEIADWLRSMGFDEGSSAA